MLKKVKQFEIWQVNLNPKKGSEQRGIRPALIIETNATDNSGKTTIIIPFTSQIEKIYPLDLIILPNKINGLEKKSKLKFRHIRVIDKMGLYKKLGCLKNKEDQEKVFETLKHVFDFERLF